MMLLSLLNEVPSVGYNIKEHSENDGHRGKKTRTRDSPLK